MDITINELKTIINPYIIDIRSSHDYYIGHINGSKNILYKDLLMHPEKYLNKNQTYYLYCTRGITSKKLTNILNNQGYKTISIVGGYMAYQNLKTY